MSRSDRQHTRHETVLAVRFVKAAEFVMEYAENLSAGGLFVRQAHKLEALSEVTVEIELAGFETFQVKARVAHVLGEEMAAKMGRQPGAGLQLVDVPPGFEAALTSYLARLGKRRDYLLLAEDPNCVSMLSEAGFRVEDTDIDRVIEKSLGADTILAVVVPKSTAAGYREMLAVSPKTVPVIGCHCQVDEEPLLAELDRLVVQRSKRPKTTF